ncbi:predicted protein [Sclerotinia sclerotiorum 1980 UF-70]|uniref:Uncharacterized protein n=1 Tax=Sclerotinia sclerotiorum (strain ATCC 18683 / 1980 / Ss-1) TaxID=665079 RepID=A7ERN1_SCLS1|nr:predicted protein [Sclerotinia sclerotiorum 1980 UF-70]EDN92123.1 predicted protein [Sclerotinia sclerotiorum 1980 UF-70]
MANLVAFANDPSEGTLQKKGPKQRKCTESKIKGPSTVQLNNLSKMCKMSVGC